MNAVRTHHVTLLAPLCRVIALRERASQVVTVFRLCSSATMGQCLSSQPSSGAYAASLPPAMGAGGGLARRGSFLSERVSALILEREAHADEELAHPFNRILLKFPVMRIVFRSIKSSFETARLVRKPEDGKTTLLPFDTCIRVLRDLGCAGSEGELRDICKEAERYGSDGLHFREFLVALALAYMLGHLFNANASDAMQHASSRSNLRKKSSRGLLRAADATPSSPGAAGGTPSPAPPHRETSRRGPPPSPSAGDILLLANRDGPALLRAQHAAASSTAAATASGTGSGVSAASGVDSPAPLRARRASAVGILHASQETGDATPSAGSAAAVMANLTHAVRRLSVTAAPPPLPPATPHVPKASFTEAQAMALEGDTDAAAALAAVAAAHLHENIVSEAPADTSTQGAHAVDVTDGSAGHTRDERVAVVSRVIAYVFHLVLEAYMQLDMKRRGVIHKDDLRAGMAQLTMMSSQARSKVKPPTSNRTHTASQSSASAASARALPVSALEFLTEERFNELDWNEDGEITFREFLFAFVSWVGTDEEEDEDDEELEAMAKHRSGSAIRQDATPDAAATGSSRMLATASAGSLHHVAATEHSGSGRNSRTPSSASAAMASVGTSQSALPPAVPTTAHRGADRSGRHAGMNAM